MVPHQMVLELRVILGLVLVKSQKLLLPPASTFQVTIMGGCAMECLKSAKEYLRVCVVS